MIHWAFFSIENLTNVVVAGAYGGLASTRHHALAVEVRAILVGHASTGYRNLKGKKRNIVILLPQLFFGKTNSLLRQQTPNPAAQVPEFAPPLLSHSCSV